MDDNETADWIMQSYSSQNRYYSNGEQIKIGRAEARRCDKEVKYCKQCNLCWELIKTCRDIDLEHYSDFERYGKERKICPTCEQK